MQGFVWPEVPDFADDSERDVFDAIRKDLRDGDALFHGLRFTSAKDGDIEIDLAVFLRDAGVAVIEVKGGRVSYNNGQWFSQSTGFQHKIDPVALARKNQYALREFLIRSKKWSRGTLRDTWLLALPYTHVEGALAPDAPRDRVLGQADMDAPMDRVRALLEDRENVSRLSAHGWVDTSIDLLLNRSEPLRDVIADAAERENHVNRLTREQGALLDAFAENQRIEVIGGAGTGKTWMAFEQVRRWSREGRRVALLSFGRGLAETFKLQADALKYNQRPAFTGTFHQLGVDWGVVAGPAEPTDWWVKTAPELMLAAALELTQGKRFDALVVDEAQDFADSWWQPLVASLRDPDTARIATFRDDHQAVFGRRGRPSLDFAKVTLSKNLRTTRQIAAAYAPLFPGLAKAVGTDGPEVTFVECAVDAVIGVASDCAAQLLEEGWAPRDIALLTTFHRHPVHIEQQQHGSTAYWANLWNGDDIFYCTASGFKGLERPAVVVAVDGFRETQEARELLYVAMSRARDKLIVVADRETLSSLLGRPG